MPIRPNSPSSARSRIAGGIRRSDFKPLHDINPLRLDYIAERCGGLAGKTVLDVGCGGGILAEAMATQGRGDGHRPVGEGARRGPAASARIEIDRRLSLMSQPKRWLSAPVGFDVVTCMELLEHVPDPAVDGRGLRPARASGRDRRLFDDQPQSQVVPVRCHRRRICAQTAAARDARLRALCCKPAELGGLRPQGRPRARPT